MRHLIRILPDLSPFAQVFTCDRSGSLPGFVATGGGNGLQIGS